MTFAEKIDAIVAIVAPAWVQRGIDRATNRLDTFSDRVDAEIRRREAMRAAAAPTSGEPQEGATQK